MTQANEFNNPGEQNLSSRHAQWPAIILGGGRSQRMGQDKAKLPWGNSTILQRIQNIFAGISSRTVLVIGHAATSPPIHDFDHVIRDERADCGPLEGIRVGLQLLANDFEVAMIGTCDAPLVVPEFYTYLLERLLETPQADIAIPVIKGQTYPLTAVWRTRTLKQVSEMVRAKELRVKDLLSKVNLLEIGEQELQTVDPRLESVQNANTPEEYQSLLLRTRQDRPDQS